jgi:hypothetical protein
MPAPIYSYINFQQMKQQVSNRLFDSAQVFWTNTEVGEYCKEALRTWNALTGYWRGDFVFLAQVATTWYDLPVLPNTLRPYTLLDTDVYKLIQYHLLEPAVGVNPWTGVSAQFTADDLINAVQRRRDELLSVCGCTVTRRTVGAIAGRIVLPDTVIDVRRMAYLPATILGGYGSGLYGMGPYGQSPTVVNASNSIIWADDTWSEQSFDRQYPQKPAGIPHTYLLSTQPPISFDTDRPPAYGGQYELLTIEAGQLLVAGTPSTLMVPDDWVHLIKWGALADLLSRDSNAQDLPRAEYCNQRYRMGLAILSMAPALLALRIGNVPVQIDSVRGADLYNTSWQGQAPGSPTSGYYAGLNMLALAPIPDGGNYSVTATVVENAPVPVNDGDPVQVARDDLDVIIDMAQHIAMTKCGGSEFLSTIPLFKRFMQQAATYNRKLDQLGEFTGPIYGLTSREKGNNPIQVPDQTAVEAD